MTTPVTAQPGPCLPPVFRLVTLASVTSTNDEAKRLARDGAPHGTLVWARRQEAGRGRRGRRWVSPEGNLYCSLILRPERQTAESGQLSFVVALAVGEAVASLLPAGVPWSLKWPNDALVRGRKVSGMLLEGEPLASGGMDWLVLGVGINVAHHPEGTEYPATSLLAEGIPPARPLPAVEALLEAFARSFDLWYGRWCAEGFAPVRAAWLARAQGIGQPVVVRLQDRTLLGIFTDLAEDGALLLDTGDGSPIRITAGDVFFSPSGAGE